MRTGKVFVHAFRACCIATAFFVIFKQFEIYKRSSEKVETISFRRFGMKPDDHYPTFTYCFYIDNLNSSFDNTQDLDKTLLGNQLQDGILFYDVMFTDENSIGVVNQNNWHEGKQMNTSNIYSGTEIVDDTDTEFPFIRKIEWMQKYKSAALCYTRQNNHIPTRTRIHDTVVVNVSRIFEIDAQIHVYIHHPGQLMRSLDHPVYVYRREHLCGGYSSSSHPTGLCYSTYSAHDIKMSYVSVMRLDPDAGEWRPCDRNLLYEDQEKKRFVVQELGCAPSFWNITLISSETKSRTCKDAAFELLKKLYQKLKFSDETPGQNLYKKSCNKMTVLQNTNYNPTEDMAINSKYWRMQLKFWYPPQGKHNFGRVYVGNFTQVQIYVD